MRMRGQKSEGGITDVEGPGFAWQMLRESEIELLLMNRRIAGDID